MADTLTQETFLGCSIRSFNFNIGWQNSSSVLNVSLVEDDSLFQEIGFIQVNGQSTYFTPKDLVGQLVRFDYQGWVFDGILSNLYEKKSESGNRVWEANISDPRELMDGVQIILSGYNGFTYNVPNLYNVYGYLESFGFGFSESIESGIPWNKVVSALKNLVDQTPIRLAGVPFFLDLSSLPSIPSYYRITGNSITLIGLIQEICETANFEFTCILIGNTIKVVCIDRNIGYIPGAIDRFLRSINSDYVEMQNGFELQYNTTNKFVVGSQVEQVYYQFNAVGPNSIGKNGIKYNPTFDDTISRYWGLDINGNVITAQREALGSSANQYFANESFYVDGRAISYPGIQWAAYPMDIMELRSALNGRDSWEGFLVSNNFGLHAGKANRLKILGDMRDDLLKDFNSIKNANIADVVKFDRNQNLADQHEAYIEKVFEFVSNFATNYMGKQFMVRIPFVFARNDALTGQIETSLEPTDSGYVEESLFNQAVANGLMPNFTDFVTDEEGKITSYVRFGPFSVEELDLSALSENDFYISGPYLFVKCTVDKKIVYLDRTTGFSPRVVIELPGPIKFTNELDILTRLEAAYINEIVFKEIKDNTIQFPPAINNPNTAKRSEILDAFFQEAIDYKAARDKNQPTTPYGSFAYDKIMFLKQEFLIWKKQVGAEYGFIGIEPPTLVPSMAAIPLKNNRQVYGPWYSSGFEGKVDFEQNFDLNPWTFGGFANMNRVGQAMVSSIYTNTMIHESGSITVPGTPELQPATTLILSGPFITQIDVSVGDTGVTTSYSLGRWNATYGKQISENIENFKKIYRIKKEQARAFRSLFKPKSVPNIGNIRFGSRKLPRPKPRRIRPSTTHSMIMCSIYEDKDGKTANNIGMVPYYHIQNIADGEWEKIAGASIDSIFRPYSTDPNSSGIPKFTDVSGYTGALVTVDDYNPFKVGHDIKVAIRGDDPDIDILNKGEGIEGVYRGIGLKAPLMLVGWGKDIDGNSVSGPDEDQKDWKAGPLDVRWNEDRGVWTTPYEFYEGILTTDISAPSDITTPTTFYMQHYGPSGSFPYIKLTGVSGIQVTNRDPSLSVKIINGNKNYTGKIFVMAMRINGEIRPIWIGCPELLP